MNCLLFLSNKNIELRMKISRDKKLLKGVIQKDIRLKEGSNDEHIISIKEEVLDCVEEQLTSSEENYLKEIYHLSINIGDEINTNAIASRTDTKPSSVTDMLKKLAEKQFVNYVKYQGVSLTEKGRVKAIMVIRKHRLWEVFLMDKLGFDWGDVHEIAEQLEHINSTPLIDKLDEFLGFPKKDPHGDPIPDQYGRFYDEDKMLLSQSTIGENVILIGVKDSSKEFL